MADPTIPQNPSSTFLVAGEAKAWNPHGVEGAQLSAPVLPLEKEPERGAYFAENVRAATNVPLGELGAFACKHTPWVLSETFCPPSRKL